MIKDVTFVVSQALDRVQDLAAHLLLFSLYSFSAQVWIAVKIWLGMKDISPSDWSAISRVKDWWTEVIHENFHHTKR